MFYLSEVKFVVVKGDQVLDREEFFVLCRGDEDRDRMIERSVIGKRKKFGKEVEVYVDYKWKELRMTDVCFNEYLSEEEWNSMRLDSDFRVVSV